MLRALPLCRRLLVSRLNNVLTPASDRAPYSAIAQATAHDPHNWLYHWAIFDDMASAGHPSTALRQLLQSLRYCNSQHTWKVLDEIRRREIPLDSDMLSQLILHATHNQNLELSLRYLHILKSNSLLHAPLSPVQSIIILAAKQNQSRLAIDIALWFEHSQRKRLQKRVWVACLASTAATLFADGLLVSWHKAVSSSDPVLTEGLSTIVLQAARRLHLTELAEEIVSSESFQACDPYVAPGGGEGDTGKLPQQKKLKGQGNHLGWKGKKLA